MILRTDLEFHSWVPSDGIWVITGYKRVAVLIIGGSIASWWLYLYSEFYMSYIEKVFDLELTHLLFEFQIR